MEGAGKLAVLVGALLVALGLWLLYGPALPWLGRLPGDLRIERPGFRLSLPLASCLALSAALSALLWLWSRLR